MRPNPSFKRTANSVAPWPRSRAVAALEHNIVRVLVARVIAAEIRVTHEVANGLHQIPVHLKTEMIFRRLIAPFDATIAVEQHDAVGRCLKRSEDVMQARIARLNLQLRLT